MKYFIATLFFCFILHTACKTHSNSTNSSHDQLNVIENNMDTTISPGENFFLYANGMWIKNNPIPSDETNWGIGNLVIEENNSRLRTICEKSASNISNSNSVSNKIGMFWKLAMDSLKREQLGLTPIQSELNEINAIKTIADLQKQIAKYVIYGMDVPFAIYIDQDMKNSDKIALYLSQGGLGLPNRDYYFNTDERTLGIRKEYPNHISSMLAFLKESQGNEKARAEKIVALETILAHGSKKLEDLRDPNANYHPYAIQKLKSLTPSLDWNSIFSESSIKIDTVIVGQENFMKTVENLLKTSSLDVWKDYLKWRLISEFANTLPSEVANQNFAFYGKKIKGLETQRPLWKRSLNAVEQNLGDALGQEFAKAYFGEKEKKRYSDMVENIRDVFREHIENLDWMSPETKQKALTKLSTVTKKVGYPDVWKDFSAMKLDTISYFNNLVESRKWWHNYSVQKIGKPVDRTEWTMTPQTYNAYYNPSNNEIVLPAAIFAIPGFRDEMIDDAVVYGYAGASTIGHEITHGFDDEGRQFDDKGNLKQWWTEADEKEFNKRADKVIKQFNDFIVLDSMHINGKATLGENIADLGGVVLGLDAFKKTEQYKQNKMINGLTPTQRYFIGYALGWMSHTRKENLADRLMTDVHSPAEQRVNGPFVNLPEFYEAFNLKPSDKMFRADSLRAKIW